MIDQIKESLAKATQGEWWHYQTNNSVVVDPKDPIFIRRTIASELSFDDAKFVSNTPTYIRYLLDELEKANTALYTHESYDRTVSELHEENEQLRTEHAAMKEALEWYADEKNHEENVTDQWEPVLPIRNDEGEKARSVLSTIIKDEPNE